MRSRVLGVSLKEKAKPSVGFNSSPFLKGATPRKRDLASDFSWVLRIYLYIESITAACVGLGKARQFSPLNKEMVAGWAPLLGLGGGSQGDFKHCLPATWYGVGSVPGPPAFWVP